MEKYLGCLRTLREPNNRISKMAIFRRFSAIILFRFSNTYLGSRNLKNKNCSKKSNKNTLAKILKSMNRKYLGVFENLREPNN